MNNPYEEEQEGARPSSHPHSLGERWLTPPRLPASTQVIIARILGTVGKLNESMQLLNDQVAVRRTLPALVAPLSPSRPPRRPARPPPLQHALVPRPFSHTASTDLPSHAPLSPPITPPRPP